MNKLIVMAAAAAAFGVTGAAQAATCVLAAGVEKCTFTPGDAAFQVTFNPDGSISANLGRSGIGSTTDIGPGTGTPGSPLSFQDTYSFIIDADGIGTGILSTSVTTAQLFKATDLDFSGTATFNGAPVTYTFTANKKSETLGTDDEFPIVAFANNELVISGIARGNGAYGGALTFVPTSSPVPEPATWSMMLVGFGAAGFGLRRRRKEETRVRFAF